MTSTTKPLPVGEEELAKARLIIERANNDAFSYLLRFSDIHESDAPILKQILLASLSHLPATGLSESERELVEAFRGAVDGGALSTFRPILNIIDRLAPPDRLTGKSG